MENFLKFDISFQYALIGRTVVNSDYFRDKRIKTLGIYYKKEQLQ